MSVETMAVVYECPSCEEHLMDRPSPDCNLFCRRLGRWRGSCPGCLLGFVLATELGAGR